MTRRRSAVAVQQRVREAFGTTAEGAPVERITLARAGGLRARVLTRGATLASLHAPDRRGDFADVVLGFDELAGYERSGAYMGCVVGRVANRIAGARFHLDGRPVRLSANEGENHLHGGARGLDRAIFRVAELAPDRVRLCATSPEGDQGYPGRLDVEVVYALEDDALVLELGARSDRPTPVNLSHHAYWNLSGRPGADVRDHRLASPATHRVVVDDALLPSGELAPLSGTPFDFREGAELGSRIEASGGFDVHLVLPEPGAGREASEPRPAATLWHPPSGRRLELLTTQPGFQLYTAAHLCEPAGKGGAAYRACAGVCLEPQHPPDAVNQPAFPSIVLRPGETYRQLSRFRFGVAREGGG